MPMTKTFYLNSDITLKDVSKGSAGLNIAGYANTTDRDRVGDVVTAQAWASGIKNFRKNPVLLYQHKHDCPIGRVDKVTVDKKGIFVEANVSDAAEKLHAVQTLIKDGALKSFSVGFKVNDGKYDHKTDSMTITDVELLEISVVSVPANQESLFSVRKSFDDNDQEYSKFVEEFANKKVKSDTTEKDIGIKVGVTDVVNDHYHTYEIDNNGSGVTTYTSHNMNHYHMVDSYRILEAHEGGNHSHTMVVSARPVSAKPEEEIDTMNDARPLSPSEQLAPLDASQGAPPAVVEELSESTPVEVKAEDVIDESVDKITEEVVIEEIKAEIAKESLDAATVTEEIVEDEIEESDPYQLIPFVNMLSMETGALTHNHNVKYGDKRYKIIKIATAESSNFKFLEIDLNGNSRDNSITVEAEKLAAVNTWDIGSKYDISLVNISGPSHMTDSDRKKIKETYHNLHTLTEQEAYELKSKELVKTNANYQQKLNTILNIRSVSEDEWTDSDYKYVSYTNTMIRELNNMEPSKDRNISLALHGVKYEPKKENDNMATQPVGDIVKIDTGASEKKSGETAAVVASSAPIKEAPSAPAAEVSEPRVAELVQKTGEAILEETNAQIKTEVATPTQSDEVAELKAEVSKYREQISAYTQNKMVYQESKRSGHQFSAKEMTNAYLLSKALNKKDPFDTKFGARMKQVTSVDQFLSNFSTNVYEEMQQQLVVAPMFERIAVDARNFRVPVADEDTAGDVAQFESGTFAQSISDATRVPTTRQNTISAVTFSPNKFMATTHLAKDEEEDVILPLLDFLRQSATRRLARAIDKGILRGDGALRGFNAAPTNAITAGSGYQCVFKGVVTLANDISGLRVASGGNSTKATPANIASARGKLKKYGLQLGNQLVFLTSVEGYNSLVSNSDFQTVDKFGPNATYLTGSLGAIYGIPVVITEFLDDVGSSGNEIGLLLYKPGFLIAERRGMEIESEYEPRQQVTAMYMSTRFDFKALTTNSDAALDATKYPYASVIRSNA
jgi:HK97 family phage prohead protease/HK97 family phage major capsid protein